ncbi:hypothetical protein GT23_3179 [Parageobacillus thermoglucosidasius]|nr:hypothetical protein GT23_3179 [Parageobacillus thermoglucosidasius]
MSRYPFISLEKGENPLQKSRQILRKTGIILIISQEMMSNGVK